MSYIKINDEEIALIWLHLPIALETDQKRTVEIRNTQKDSFSCFGFFSAFGK